MADFVIDLGQPGLCAVPESLPVDPEGAKAPLPSPAPYFVAQYVPGERIVLERNRFYKGARPQHVDRFDVELGVDIATAFGRVEDGSADYALGPPTYFVENAARLARRYGVNKGQFFVDPGTWSAHVRPQREPARSSRPTSSSGRQSTSPSIAGR